MTTDDSDYRDAELYHSIPEVAPTDRPELRDGQPTDYWANLGDHSPIRHGGLFCRFSDDPYAEWECVIARPPGTLPQGFDSYMIRHASVYPGDIWADPDDPLTDWSERARQEWEALNNEVPLPNTPPTFGKLTRVIHGIAREVEVREDWVLSPEPTPEDYWDEIEKYGVGPGEVVGVSDATLPDGVEQYTIND